MEDAVQNVENVKSLPSDVNIQTLCLWRFFLRLWLEAKRKVTCGFVLESPCVRLGHFHWAFKSFLNIPKDRIGGFSWSSWLIPDVGRFKALLERNSSKQNLCHTKSPISMFDLYGIPMQFIYFEDGQQEANRPSLWKHHRHCHLWARPSSGAQVYLYCFKLYCSWTGHSYFPRHGQHKSAAVHEAPSQREVVLWPSNSVLPFSFEESSIPVDTAIACLLLVHLDENHMFMQFNDIIVVGFFGTVVKLWFCLSVRPHKIFITTTTLPIKLHLHQPSPRVLCHFSSGSPLLKLVQLPVTAAVQNDIQTGFEKRFAVSISMSASKTQQSTCQESAACIHRLRLRPMFQSKCSWTPGFLLKFPSSWNNTFPGFRSQKEIPIDGAHHWKTWTSPQMRTQHVFFSCTIHHVRRWIFFYNASVENPTRRECAPRFLFSPLWVL